MMSCNDVACKNQKSTLECPWQGSPFCVCVCVFSKKGSSGSDSEV